MEESIDSMIQQSLALLIEEVAGLWIWVVGIVAGWGMTLTFIICALVVMYVRIRSLHKQILRLESRSVAENRDMSMRLQKLEK
jgi:uncharacterized membrane protein YciS (DUF1049 family)